MRLPAGLHVRALLPPRRIADRLRRSCAAAFRYHDEMLAELRSARAELMRHLPFSGSRLRVRDGVLASPPSRSPRLRPGPARRGADRHRRDPGATAARTERRPAGSVPWPGRRHARRRFGTPTHRGLDDARRSAAGPRASVWACRADRRRAPEDVDAWGPRSVNALVTRRGPGVTRLEIDRSRPPVRGSPPSRVRRRVDRQRRARRPRSGSRRRRPDRRRGGLGRVYADDLASYLDRLAVPCRAEVERADVVALASTIRRSAGRALSTGPSVIRDQVGS